MNNHFKKDVSNSHKEHQEMIRDQHRNRLVNKLNEYLLDHSTILELGSGEGTDLLKLSRNYQVTGSDISPVFVEKFKEKHPEIDMKILDARIMNIEDKYDCIYSNKVLSHLTEEELVYSLTKQEEHLKDDGIIFMTLTYGAYREEEIEDGLVLAYYNETKIGNLVPETLRIEIMETYYDKEKDDSLLVILKKRTA